jgi:asparagine synthase (glutamine-hydrolysing)
VLTGEGADELFAGYTLFKEDSIRRFWAKRPESGMRPALLSRIHHYVGSAEARSNALWRDFFGYRLTETDHTHYAHLVRWRNNAWALRLLAPEIRNSISPEALEENLSRAVPQHWMSHPPLERAQIAEMETFMSPYLLAAQADRVAMANGVEARYPFLDMRVVDFALSLPANLKLRGLSDKIVLRKLAARKLPRALWARKKQPFRAPIASALLSRESLDGLAGVLERDALIDPKSARLFLDRVRRRDGRGLGEREEMGVVGLITICMLARSFGSNFDGAVDRGVAEMQKRAPTVMIDRSASAASENKKNFVGSL